MPPVIDRNIVKKLNRPIDEAYGLPGDAYTDPFHFAAEQKKIFHKTWVCVGFETDLPNAGDILPTEVGGAPIILLRGRNKEIRAFHNICRHKGNLLVSEPKVARRSLVCAYHCWTYDLTGRLLAARNFGGLGKEWEGTCRKKEDLGLFLVNLANWHGWLFVNLDNQASPFEDYAVGMIRAFKGYDFSDMRLISETECLFEANWKLTFENFFDNYHVPYIHRESLKLRNKELYESDDKTGKSVRRLTNEGPYFGIEHNYPPESLDASFGLAAPPDMSNAWRTRIIYLHLFPNLLIFAHSDHLVGIVETPTAPNRAHQRVMIFTHGEGSLSDEFADQRQFCAEFWNKVNNEDVGVCGTLQKGRESPAFDGGIFAPAWESQIHAYQKLVADYMTR